MFKRLALIALSFVLVACSSTKEPTDDFTYKVITANDINPDINGNASSVVVRVFQLTNKVNFDNAGYDAIFGGDDSGLGAELLTLDEYLVSPSSNESFEVQVPESAKFIGVAVGYRSAETDKWKELVDIQERSFWKDGELEIRLKYLSLSVTQK